MLMNKSVPLVHIQISFYTEISFKGSHDIADVTDLGRNIKP